MLLLTTAFLLLQGCITEQIGPLQDLLVVLDTSSQIEVTGIMDNVSIKSMLLKEETAFITGSFNESESDHLISFDTLTAQPNWTVNQSTGIVAVSENMVYVWGRDPGLVISLDKESGTTIWQVNVDWEFPIIDAIDVTPLGLLIESRNPNGNRFHLLDKETGEKLYTFQSNEEKQEYWINHGYTTYSVKEEQVSAIGSVNWQTRLNFKSFPYDERTQLIIADDVIVAYKIYDNHVQMASLNKTDGKLLWEVDTNLISNLSVMDGLLFFVSNSNEANEVKLLSIDLKNGGQVNQVTFSPQIQDLSGQNTKAIVSADSGQVFVYFSSTCQLFKFRLVF